MLAGKSQDTLSPMFGESKLPLVTIVTPSLNQGSFIRGAIESVLGQSYPNIEYIIMDAGSTDETSAVVERYADRLVWISEPDRGQSHAINKGWKMGRGEILAWLCADDLLLPGTVQTVVETFNRHPDASFVYGGCEYLDRAGRHFATSSSCVPDTWKLIHGYDYVAQPAAFVARRATEEVGYVDETLHFGMDWDLFIRLSKVGRTVPIPTVLARAHIYPETKSVSGGNRRWRELVVIMRRHGERRYPPGYWIYGAETIRSICQRWARGLPQRLSRPTSLPKRWVHYWLNQVHYFAVSKVSNGWFDDNWAGPKVTRRLTGNGETLALSGRVPNWEYPFLLGQRLKVTCDGTVIADRDVIPGSFSWELPMPESDRKGEVEIKILAHRSFVPQQFGINQDPRRLAFYLDELALK